MQDQHFKLFLGLSPPKGGDLALPKRPQFRKIRKGAFARRTQWSLTMNQRTYIRRRTVLAALLAAVILGGGLIGCRKAPETSDDTETQTTSGMTAEGSTAHTPATPTPPDDSLAGRFGPQIEALGGSYASYGFREVEETPLLDISFDTSEDLSLIPNLGSAGGQAGVTGAEGAGLIPGRFELRKALEFTTPGGYITAPDLGEQDALTISMWVNLKDISSRASESDTRVTTLLDTRTGTGRVKLSFVHTGSTLNTDESGALVSNPKSTKLVFSVEGNEGGTFEGSGLYANNTHYSNFEYTIPEAYNTWIAHPEGHCWFHIGIVYNPATGEVTFYHEGKLDSTQKFTTAVKPVLNGIRIGAGYEDGQGLDGKVDDIRLYGTALTSEDMEILADYERDMWVYRTITRWEESEITLYVDGAKGSDDNPGTKEAPFATVKKGVESITKEGTRLVIAPGVYREAGINLNASGTEYKPIIIEAEVPGETVISGSTVISDWETTEAPDVYCHAWSYQFPRQTGTPGNEFVGRTDMLWVDGEPTQPVFSMEELTHNTYYLDEAAEKIYFMTDKQPGEFVSEIPNLGFDPETGAGAYLLKSNSNHYFVLRGLTFTGAGTKLWDNAMVSLGFPQHILVEDCQFNNTNTSGIGWESSWIGQTAEDIVIRRCGFDNIGASGIGAGFRTMNMVVEQCEFTDIGWKINWGKYDSPDPATVKMMVCRNILYRGNRFDNNYTNDLWFDNFNWNIEVVDNVFTRNSSDVGVHIEIDAHGVLLRNNVIEGGVRWANAEGMILDGNIMYGERELICTWDSGNEFRFGEIGPVYGWQDMVLTNNVFYYTGEKLAPIIDFPNYESVTDIYSAGNRVYMAGLAESNKAFRAEGNMLSFKAFKNRIGDTTSKVLTENPFLDDGTATVAFRDLASEALGKGLSNPIPVVLSKPLDKESRVSYTVWSYDTNEIIRTGVLTFGAFESEKAIYIDEYDENVLIELTESENILIGEKSFHYQAKAE